MSDLPAVAANLPEEQEAIRARCFHPSGGFVEFKREEVEQSIPERFEQIVHRYPDRIAVKIKTHEVTYDALNKTANRVAHAILTHRGRGAEPITLLLEHGAAVIVAIFGVLKAGKFYVPLDPSHPPARTDYILNETQAGLIVTNTRNFRLASKLARDGCRLVNIDDLDSHVSSENPSVSTTPDTYAYVLYTSGSTGQPKGVIQNHRNLLHRVMISTNSLHLCTADRLTLLHSCSFSASVDNFFSALLNGASLFPFNIKEDGVDNLAVWLNREQITIYHSVPSVFRHLAATLTGKENFPKIRIFRVGGEQVTSRDVDLYKKIFSQDCIFVSALGSNESGPIRRYFLDKSTEISGQTVPAGYALEDKEVLLLGESGKEVGCNCVGEIALKSRYLSPGYWRRPDLTEAAFLPDPEEGDKRIYLTGDLGLMLPDGCLMHLGRKDFQVKIRGQRIEVAEIENVLRGLDTIKEAVVVTREVRPDDKHLVAYVVPTKQRAPSTTELRRALAEKLPYYMIPSTFLFLEALPLTPNGKVDRKALPDPGNSRADLDTQFVAPRNPVEEQLVQIWAEVLGRGEIGVCDNFFELGGHSLAATRVASRVVKEFQLELPVQSLFQAPTVAEMAGVIAQNQGKKMDGEDLARMLAELEALSEDEARRLLSDKGARQP